MWIDLVDLFGEGEHKRVTLTLYVTLPILGWSVSFDFSGLLLRFWKLATSAPCNFHFAKAGWLLGGAHVRVAVLEKLKMSFGA